MFHHAGGVVIIGIDHISMNAYVIILPNAETLDSFLQTLIDSQVIPAELTERCEVETQFIGSGSVQVSFGARDADSDAQFCHEQSQLVATKITDFTLSAGDYAPHEILRFASVAISSPAATSATSEDSGKDGALGLAVSCLALVMACLFAVMAMY